MSESQWIAGWLASEETAQDIIAVKRVYIDINEGNLYDGLIFSQIMYWHGRNKETGKTRLSVKHGGELWLAKSYEDWYPECRIIAATARKCIDRIEGRGLIIKKLFKFDGAPVVHIRVNWPEVETRIKSICYLVSNPIDTTGQMDTIQQVKSLTDTTPKTTTKNTTPRKRDEIFDTIAKVWNITAPGYIGQMKSMMLGIAKRGTWKDCNFDIPVTAEEIAAFETYAHKRMAEKNIQAIPTAAVTIQRWFYDFRNERAKASAPRGSTPLDDSVEMAKMMAQLVNGGGS